MRSSQQEIASTSNDAHRVAVRAQKGNVFNHEATKRITKLATFVALSLVMKYLGNVLSSFVQTIKFTLIYVPWLLSGIVCGPLGGACVGAVSDLLGNFIFGSPFFPLTFFSDMLYPVFIGLLYKYARPLNDYVKVMLGSCTSLLACTLGIGSLSLYVQYGYYETTDFLTYLGVYRLPQVLVFAVNLILLILLIKPFKKMGLIPNYNIPNKGVNKL